jgi:hypothetical protein
MPTTFLCAPCCKFDFNAVASRSGARAFTTMAGSHAARVTAPAECGPPAPMPAFMIATSMGRPASARRNAACERSSATSSSSIATALPKPASSLAS